MARLIAILLNATLLGFAPPAMAFPWVVDATEARRHLEAGAALLDVRSQAAFGRLHWPGARHVRWQAFSRLDAPHGGELAGDARLARAIKGLGIGVGTTLVVGSPAKGWGEDGRVVWTLRVLGHRRVALVDGGWRALRARGIPPTSRRSRSAPFTARRDSRWRASITGVKRALGKGHTVLVDTREEREFRGKTPYGERRGGHLPGAIHLHYKSLLRGDRLLPLARLRRLLAARGITKGKRIITYCTGGVRSAHMAVVLIHLGYPNVRNYAGSMWQWAARPASSHPLEGK